MREIGVLDAETDPFDGSTIPKPFIWGVWLYNTFHEFPTAAKMVDYLKRQRVIVYAHNGGKFDYHFMLEFLEPYSEIMVINGRLARFKIGLCEFRDSWNIIPVPLAAYKKEKIDYSIFTRANRRKKGNWYRIREYLKSDCIYLHELVTEYVSQFGLNLTQASGAMRFWKKMSGLAPPRWETAELAAEFYDEFKPYYYGGRVEAFAKGVIDGRFQVADINSAYPFAMQEYHPFAPDFDTWTGAEIRGRGIEGPSFYDVECVSAGAFPYRDDSEMKLLFPNDGTMRLYRVTGWELQAALECKLLRNWKIRRCSRFREMVSFREYVRHFYDLRLEAKAKGDAANTLLYKLAMNSLYGKFASDPRNYGTFTIYPAKDEALIEADDERPGQVHAGYMGDWAVGRAELDGERQRFYNVATAASITGYVRAYLLRAIRQCGGVLYCDTDSIAAAKLDKLPFGKELGQWGVEDEFDRAAIAGRKLYAFRYARPKVDPETGRRVTWKVRSKGVRLDWREMLKIARGGEVEYNPQAPTYSVHHAPVFIPRKVRMT